MSENPLTIEEVAAKVVQKFRNLYSNNPDFFGNLVESSVKANIEREIAERSNLNFGYQELIDSALNKWIARGEIKVPLPKPSVIKQAEKELASLSSREVTGASERKMQHIYVSHNNGESFKSIADRLFIGENHAEQIYKNACAQVSSIRAQLAAYGLSHD